MGEWCQYQPLTREDKVTVILYRLGIALSTLAVFCIAVFAIWGKTSELQHSFVAPFAAATVVALYFSVGLSVFFIHLYIGRFYRILKKIYYVSVFCLLALFFLGNGNPALPLFSTPPYAALLLLPLSLCMGFVTAKEAFCFRLFEGYILAIIMPAYLFFYSTGLATGRGTVLGLIIVAALLLVFAFRKVFMPLHCDIGDKSAYQP